MRVYKVQGRAITKEYIHMGERGWKMFRGAYESTEKSIAKGENSSLLSVLHYYLKRRHRNYKNDHSRKISRRERTAWRLIRTNGKSKWQ